MLHFSLVRRILFGLVSGFVHWFEWHLDLARTHVALQYCLYIWNSAHWVLVAFQLTIRTCTYEIWFQYGQEFFTTARAFRLRTYCSRPMRNLSTPPIQMHFTRHVFGPCRCTELLKGFGQASRWGLSGTGHSLRGLDWFRSLPLHSCRLQRP